jgi:dynein heavy chain, axonemal
MDIVLFDYAIVHLMRLCRVLKMERGNSLLIGLGGSGRQSLAALAAKLMNNDHIKPETSKQYNLDQWQDDLKIVLQKTGCENEKVSFMLTDAQLKFSFMLEDVNNLLNSYDVPNLY